jgi:hypothetical protein
MSNEQITHDRLQYEAFTWAHNTIPQIRGRLFAVLNEIKTGILDRSDTRPTTQDHSRA